MSKYDFNAERCQKAISSLSKVVYDKSYTSGIPDRDKVLLGVILDDLILDIEALHQAAQERDHVLDALLDATYDEYIDRDELLRVYDCYTDEEGNLPRTADLDL